MTTHDNSAVVGIINTLNNSNNNNQDDPIQPHTSRRSFTREQRLAAIIYAENTYMKDKNGNVTLITRYQAAKDLGLQVSQLKSWQTHSSRIESQKEGQRTNRQGRRVQEPELEAKLAEQSIQQRQEGRRINRKWFLRQARQIYRDLHPERVTRDRRGRYQYKGFRFSDGWLRAFRRRHKVLYTDSTQRAPASSQASYMSTTGRCSPKSSLRGGTLQLSRNDGSSKDTVQDGEGSPAEIAQKSTSRWLYYLEGQEK